MIKIAYRRAKNSNTDIYSTDHLIVNDADLGTYVDILIKSGMVIESIKNEPDKKEAIK
jgi:hypothetical protein